MQFFIDLHVFFIILKRILNKHYITLDNSYKLLYAVIKKRREGIT